MCTRVSTLPIRRIIFSRIELRPEFRARARIVDRPWRVLRARKRVNYATPAVITKTGKETTIVKHSSLEEEKKREKEKERETDKCVCKTYQAGKSFQIFVERFHHSHRQGKYTQIGLRSPVKVARSSLCT